MTPFDFVKEIQFGKRNLMVDPQAEKDYKPFQVNKALSYHLDCLMEANAMNLRPHLNKTMQFAYLLNSIRNRRRPFAPWVKPETREDLDAVKTFFECSDRKAQEALGILTKEQIETITQLTTESGPSYD